MFKRAFSFEGRIRRLEFGLSILIYWAFLIGAAAIGGVVSGEAGGDSMTAVMALAYIPALWFLWAQGAKRCHDRGNSGWFQLIPFYVLVMIFGPGETGDNGYGADPKGENQETTPTEVLDEHMIQK